MIFPTTFNRNLGVICSVSLGSLGSDFISITGFSLASEGSAVYPSANLALYVPFYMQVPGVVTQMFTANGSTAGNNVDVGIYSADGTRLVSSGSTAQSGTSVEQIYNITDTLLGPGVFYMAVAMDGTTGTLRRVTPGAAPIMTMLGMAQQATAFALPAVATMATCTTNYLPLFGLLFERTAI